MPAVTLTPADLAPFATIEKAKADEMIADALGLATLAAPCIITEGFAYPAAAKAVLRGAILRWNEAGTGARGSQTAGPYAIGFDTSTPRRRLFWPSEIEDLQKMCRDANASNGAFSIDTAPGGGSAHSMWCSLLLGGDTCSCGIGLTAGAFPIWEPDGA